MSAKIEIDASSALNLTRSVLRQIPYATSNAINRTAKEAVIKGKEEVAKDFTIRTNFALSRVQVLEYSRPNNLQATMGINNKVQGTPPLLSYFESGEGGVKLPLRGSELAVAITGNPARPTFSQKISDSKFSYKKLHIMGGRGNFRTFVIPKLGVFRRVGPKPRDLQLLYAFEHEVPLLPRMNIRARFAAVIRERFPELFYEEMHKELSMAGIPKWKS